MPGLLINSWLMFPNPEDFWRGESGERRVGNQLNQLPAPAGQGFDLGALCGGTLVVPEQRRAKRFGSITEEDASVHLAGKADPADVACLDFRLFQHGARCGARGLPPILWALLGP